MLRGLCALLAAGLIAWSGCGEGERPLRVGVVVECVGFGRPLRDAELSGAQLPLIERGAERNGRRARRPWRAGGSRPSRGAGPRCTEGGEFSWLTREVRRLTEDEGVEAVVASTGLDELVMRDLARAHPEVVFLPVVHGPREVTLQQRPHNLFRFVADNGQGVAGLATYVFRELGWRHAAIVIGHWPSGWLERDAFAAEFCALGGRVTDQIGMFEAGARDARAGSLDVDGVAVFTGQFYDHAAFITRLAARIDDPTRELVVGPGVVDAPRCCAPPRLRWQGSYRPRRWTRFECAITCGGMRGPPRRLRRHGPQRGGHGLS